MQNNNDRKAIEQAGCEAEAWLGGEDRSLARQALFESIPASTPELGMAPHTYSAGVGEQRQELAGPRPLCTSGLVR